MTSALSLPKVDALEAALDGLAGDYLPGVSRTEQADRALRLLKASQRLEGIMAVGLAEAERAGVALLGKQRTMAQYLASCLLYTSPSPRDQRGSRMPSSA